ncbi:MAG: phenylacetate--CoA ligase family protein [Bryobacteraceae bacterium]
MTGFPSRAEIESVQASKLATLLGAILPGNAFYRQKLAGAGAIRSLEDFKRHVPFTRKPELSEDQRVHPPFGTNLTYPLDRYSRFSQTSSTTGKPLRWLDTFQSWSWMLDCWTRVFREAGVTAGDRVFCAFSFGPFLGFWVAFEAAARMDCLCVPGGGMPSAARIAVMIDLGVTVLCATPTYAIHLAEVAGLEGIDLGRSSVKTIVVAGEPGGSIPGTRRRIEEMWRGARVVDHHGMTETGPVTYGCRKRAGVLHVIEEEYIAETIDPATSLPVAPGSRGELVLTNLGRLGSPLLRYRSGDIVRVAAGERCECGTTEMALEGGIIGRTDDMVVVRGVNVYPSAVEDIVRAAGCAGEYRVEVSSVGSLAGFKILVEGEEGLGHRIESAVRNALSLRVAVEVVPAGSLPRFEMKARRWVRAG